jgi:hypothetical protein
MRQRMRIESREARTMKLTAEERKILDGFLRDAIERHGKPRPVRPDLLGLASRNAVDILKIHHPGLAEKIGTRETLIDAARELGFAIRAYRGGRGLKGTGVWETINLPDEETPSA